MYLGFSLGIMRLCLDKQVYQTVNEHVAKHNEQSFIAIQEVLSVIFNES